MKKKQLFGLIIAVLVTLLIPNNINAKETKIMCKYQYQNQDLIYTIDSKVKLPFKDGENNWYHGQDFAEYYFESAKSNVCPTLTIEESSSFTTIFNNPRSEDECNGTCTTIAASSYSSNNNIDVKKAVDTTAISSVGIYNQDNYFIPYFRLLNDGTKEWSIDGKNYISATEKITGSINNSKVEISLDESLINAIYNNDSLNSNVTIYRNVKKSDNTYFYLLANQEIEGYNLKDGQETSARAYHAAYGDPDMDEWLDDYNQNQDCTGDNSILGNYNDPNSVAYLLQIIFNWLKLIGPFIVVVMSGIDFAKVIVMGDDEGMKKAQSKLIIRLILAAFLFFLPDLITAFLDLFNITSSGICGLQ